MSNQVRRKHAALKLAATLIGAALVGVLFTASLFGDNIRALFGASCDSLSGSESWYLARAPSSPGEMQSGDRFNDHGVNGRFDTRQDRFSTFAIDVDTASYSFARRAIGAGRLPYPTSVRVEEFVNAFSYDYPAPSDAPFSVSVDGMPSPFDPSQVFLRVGLQGRRIDRRERKPARLVFLVDVSGSMRSEDKLPLAKEALKILTRNLEGRDEVALVTYAGNTALVLPPTSASERSTIEEAIESLGAGGGTAMNSGLETAYALARKGLQPQTISRVIVLSDGDANFGPSSLKDLLARIETGAKEGVTLTTVGFGVGNYNDATMEELADQGNGQNVYIDSLKEARKVFETQLQGTLEVIAKDTKIQLEFDPSKIQRYRLVGYENRDLADRDFRDDAKDAGEIGAGHSVTAIYELTLTEDARPGGDYSFGSVRVRAKAPDAGEADSAKEWSFPMQGQALAKSGHSASPDLRFAVGVAALADRLRGSPFAASWSVDTIVELNCDNSQGQEEREAHCELTQGATRLLREQS